MKPSKNELRVKFREIRKDFYKTHISSLSVQSYEDFYTFYLKQIQKILKNPKDLKIAGFYPIKEEPDCLFILKRLQKLGFKSCLPVIKNFDNDMFFREYNDKNTGFIKDFYGVPAPDEKSEIMKPDVILVPFLAFDDGLFRLGYGKGCYDKLLGSDILKFGFNLSFSIFLKNVSFFKKITKINWFLLGFDVCSLFITF